jgi:hypothetical protein
LRTLVDFRRYFRIEYLNRVGAKRIKWFNVDAFGSKEIPDDAGWRQFQVVKESMRRNEAFVFYSMNIDHFWNIVQRIAPMPIQPRASFYQVAVTRIKAMFSARTT